MINQRNMVHFFNLLVELALFFEVGSTQFDESCAKSGLSEAVGNSQYLIGCASKHRPKLRAACPFLAFSALLRRYIVRHLPVAWSELDISISPVCTVSRWILIECLTHHSYPCFSYEKCFRLVLSCLNRWYKLLYHSEGVDSTSQKSTDIPLKYH